MMMQSSTTRCLEGLSPLDDIATESTVVPDGYERDRRSFSNRLSRAKADFIWREKKNRPPEMAAKMMLKNWKKRPPVEGST
jgi:hypothetical protein